MEMLITGASTTLGLQVINRFRKNYPEVQISTLDDLSDSVLLQELFEAKKFDAVIHLAASGTPDYQGTKLLLDTANAAWAEEHWFRRFFYVSAEDQNANEAMMRQYRDMTLVISTCRPSFASPEFPKKAIALASENIKKNKAVPLYSKGQDVESWFWTSDNACAIDVIFHQGEAGLLYHIGGMNTWKSVDADSTAETIYQTTVGQPLLINSFQMFFNKVKGLFAHQPVNTKQIA
jgi:dTDP-glucose 4,6-dehydratase